MFHELVQISGWLTQFFYRVSVLNDEAAIGIQGSRALGHYIGGCLLLVDYSQFFLLNLLQWALLHLECHQVLVFLSGNSLFRINSIARCTIEAWFGILFREALLRFIHCLPLIW